MSAPRPAPLPGPADPGRARRASAAPSRLTVGVQAKLRALEGPALRRRVRELCGAGVTLSREDFIWALIEPQPGVFEWEAYDRLVATAARAGLELMAIPGAPPAWATASPTTAPTEPVAQAAYARFVARLAGRYGSRGSFWADRPELPRLPVRYYDVWNEPYYNVFWTGRFPDPAGYARMFRAAVQAARPVDPEAVFLLAADLTSLGPGTDAPFLSALFDAVPDLGRYADAVSVHPYASRGAAPGLCSADPRVRRFQVCRLRDVRAVLDARGARGLPIWITEIGWSTAPAAADGVGEARQAAYVGELFSLLRGPWAGLARGLVLYSYTGEERDPAASGQWFGLVRADGSRRPAWQVLAREARAELHRGAAPGTP